MYLYGVGELLNHINGNNQVNGYFHFKAELLPKICDKIVKCKQSWRRSGTSVLSLKDFKQKVCADVSIGNDKLSNKLLETAVYYLDTMGEVRRIKYSACQEELPSVVDKATPIHNETRTFEKQMVRVFI